MNVAQELEIDYFRIQRRGEQQQICNKLFRRGNKLEKKKKMSQFGLENVTKACIDNNNKTRQALQQGENQEHTGKKK